MAGCLAEPVQEAKAAEKGVQQAHRVPDVSKGCPGGHFVLQECKYSNYIQLIGGYLSPSALKFCGVEAADLIRMLMHTSNKTLGVHLNGFDNFDFCNKDRYMRHSGVCPSSSDIHNFLTLTIGAMSCGLGTPLYLSLSLQTTSIQIVACCSVRCDLQRLRGSMSRIGWLEALWGARTRMRTGARARARTQLE
eukprot:1064298-Amphidinium_carterae.1